MTKIKNRLKKGFVKAVAAAAMCATLAGCVNEAGQPSKQSIVGLTGAVAGGVIGSNVGKGKGNTAAIIGGTILGALAGSEIGKSLDRADVAYHNRTQQQAFEYNKAGTSSSWKNPDTGASGTITPTKTYEKQGRYCREYSQTIKVGGEVQKGYGTACRQSDGSWEIVQ
jgi:surface antigen